MPMKIYPMLINSIRTDVAHPACYNDILLEWLAKTPFVYTIPMDKNREQDGLYLRKLYYVEGLTSEPCSMLEMMVALALRIDQEFLGDTSPRPICSTGAWFGEMCDSLEITNCLNEYEFAFKMERFMNHQYSPDGRGGLFYVPNAPMDLREMQIWDQMGAWIVQRIGGN